MRCPWCGAKARKDAVYATGIQWKCTRRECDWEEFEEFESDDEDSEEEEQS